MKPSPSTDHFTQQQLTDFLEGKLDPSAHAKAEKLLSDCELSREAMAGFTAVPGAIAELPSLEKEIAQRSGMHASKFWLNTFIGAAAITVISVAAYFAWPGKEKEIPSQPLAQVSTTTVQQPYQTNVLPNSPLTPESEHFVNPEAKPIVKKAAAPSKDSATAHPDLTANYPQDYEAPQPLPETRKPVVPKKTEPGYNAPVGFVLDLKVTEYDKLYKGTIVQNDIQLPGVPAQYEDKESRDRDKEVVAPVREIPKDQFLVEGLQAFRDQRYGRCVERMEWLRNNNPNDLNAAFYMGVSYVKLEMYGRAIPLLDEILNAPNNVFHEEARWYKAQALRGEGDIDGARKLFTEIAGKEGFYQQKAKDALVNLK